MPVRTPLPPPHTHHKPVASLEEGRREDGSPGGLWINMYGSRRNVGPVGGADVVPRTYSAQGRASGFAVEG